MSLALLNAEELVALPDYKLIALRNELERGRCKTDLYFLSTEILGYKDFGAIHRPLCALVQSANARLSPIFNPPLIPSKLVRYNVDDEHAKHIAEWEAKRAEHE